MDELKEIERLVRDRSYDEAMARADTALNIRPDLLPDICRLKSWAFTRQSDYRSGWEAMVPLLESGKAGIADFHSAALWSLYDGRLKESRDWFLEVIEGGKRQKDHWFESSAYFYLAFIYSELGEYEKAQANLENSGNENDESRVILPGLGAMNRSQLKQRINVRRFPRL